MIDLNRDVQSGHSTTGVRDDDGELQGLHSQVNGGGRAPQQRASRAQTLQKGA